MIAAFLFILTGYLLIFLLIISVLIHKYLAVVTVEGQSMSPTLEDGDRVLVIRHWSLGWLHKGNIVLVWPWNTSSTRSTPFEIRPYIKRIVGFGGEMLTVSLNDVAETNNAYHYEYEQETSDHHGQRDWHIPQGYIFVRGDNRVHSLDSLTWGPIPLQCVLGMVLMKLPRKDLSPPHKFVDKDGLAIGQNAPSFAAQTLNGETVTLTTYRGQSIVFLFVAPTKLCRKVMPIYAALASKALEAGVTLVFVSNAEIEATRGFVHELNISVPILVAPRTSNLFLDDYKVIGTPFYCFINAQGKVQSTGYPSMRWGEWKTLAESWTGEALSLPDDVY